MNTVTDTAVDTDATLRVPRVPVMAQGHGNGQSRQVLTGTAPRGASTRASSSSEAGATPSLSTDVSAMMELRMAMRVATNFGLEAVEDQVGQKIIQVPKLLLAAGMLFADRLGQAAGIRSQMIDVILEVGSGKYPGLGLALAHACQGVSDLQISESLRVICQRWDDTEVSQVFHDARVLKIVIVSAARTPDISAKIEALIKLVKRGMSTDVDVVLKVCSLVCMNQNPDEKHVDGILLIER